MASTWNDDEQKELESLHLLINRGEATVDQFIECARIVNRVKVGIQEEHSKRKRKAQQILERGISKYPQSPELLEELAFLDTLSIKPDKVSRLVRRAIRLYQMQGRFSEADHAAKTLADYIVFDGWDALADYGDLMTAERLLRRAIKIYPLHADAHNHLGEVYEQRGDWLNAARYYWRGIQLARIDCHGIEVWNRWLAKICHSRNEATTHYWAQHGTRPLLRAFYNLALLYYRHKELGLALRFAEESLQINPNDNTGARFIAYSILRIRGNNDKLTRLRRDYGRKHLESEADQFEISCFGSIISHNLDKVRPN